MHKPLRRCGGRVSVHDLAVVYVKPDHPIDSHSYALYRVSTVLISHSLVDVSIDVPRLDVNCWTLQIRYACGDSGISPLISTLPQKARAEAGSALHILRVDAFLSSCSECDKSS
jgi:hypothetical protein